VLGPQVLRRISIDGNWPKAQRASLTGLSQASEKRLQHAEKNHGIPVYDLNSVDSIRFLWTAQMESNGQLAPHSKAGGAGMTREKKIVRSMQR